MKSPRHRVLTTEVGDVRPIASSLPVSVYERLDENAGFVGVGKAALIRRAVCKYLQEMEELRAVNGSLLYSARADGEGNVEHAAK